MADKKVQLQNTAGDSLYPKTKAELVVNADGSTLTASLDKVVETVKVNGVALPKTAKAVDIKIPAYSVSKAATADAGFSATYQLMKDGVATGEKINIPKDMVVQSGSVKTVATADQPVTGYKVGDKYIDLVLANAENSHIYVLVSDLIDVYTAGTGITITGNKVSVDSTIATKDYVDGKTVDAYTKAEADAKFAAKSTTLKGYGIVDGVTYEELP